MIREIIKPKDTNITIKIPENYVGRQIEYIIFPLENDEMNSHEQNILKSISSLKGSLQKYADPSKREFEEKAWELHVQQKYKIDD